MKKLFFVLTLAFIISNAAYSQEFTHQIDIDKEIAASYSRLTSKSYKVEGNPDIEGFFLALAPGLNGGFENIESVKEEMKTESYFTIDKKNGYLEYSQEGDGALRIQSCYWNTKSKQKMVAVYYDEHEVISGNGSDSYKINTTNYLAFFLYNPETKLLENIEPPMLEPLEMPEIDENKSSNNAMKPIHFICKLPQHGKDIKYYFGNEEDSENISWKTLKFNGLMFE